MDKLTQLCTRLDDAVALIDSASAELLDTTREHLTRQGVIYASFLSDITNGKLKASAESLRGMTAATTAYCELIEETLMRAA